MNKGGQEHLDARLREIPPSAFHGLIAKLCELDAFKGWWQGRDASERASRQRVRRRVVEVSAAASLRIGGMDRPQSAVRSRQIGGRGERGASDAAHVSGYAELLRRVFDEYRGMRLGEDLVRQFHARLLKYSPAEHAHRGRYKTVADSARSYLRRRTESPALRSADPDLTPDAMAAVTQWASTRLAASEFHPLLVIAGFVLELLAIRPFVNGNGRVSRVLTACLLLQCGYTFVPYASLDKVIADRWTDYYLALRHSQAKARLPHPDITAWLHAFLDAIRIQAREVRRLVEERPDTGLLSQNQLGVLRLLEREGEVTKRLVCSELAIPRDTAKQVLNRLHALNLVRRLGAGRAVRYRKAPPQEDGGEPR
jgi:Fic family protein